MYLEACGDNAKMLEFHKQILEDDENNEAILKRQVIPRNPLSEADLNIEGLDCCLHVETDVFGSRPSQVAFLSACSNI